MRNRLRFPVPKAVQSEPVEPTLSQAFSDSLLAAMPQLSEKPYQGVPSSNPALHLGHEVCKSTTALGLRAALHLERVRSRSTGKERDSESGLDYFGARYNSSSMGRFMSPDPLGGDLTNPQSLNRYSYVLNNPLTNTDPTGMYTCTDSKDCSSKKDQALEKSLAGLRGSKDADVARAANAYGAQNKDNGVSVGFKDLSGSGKGGDTVSTIGVSADGSLRANSAITLNSKDGGTDFTADVGHEGSHAADAQDVVRSGLTEDGQAIHAGMNITPYQSEQRAYGVTNSILNSANESRNYVCGSGGCLLGRGSSDVPGTVDRLVGGNAMYNQGGKPMSSTNQGPSVVNGVTPKEGSIGSSLGNGGKHYAQ